MMMKLIFLEDMELTLVKDGADIEGGWSSHWKSMELTLEEG